MSALIYTVFATREDARAVASQLLDERLIACANVIGRIKSLFEWDGERGEGEEIAILFKTNAERLDDAVARLETLHQYEAPAILGWRADSAGKATTAWLAALGGQPKMERRGFLTGLGLVGFAPLALHPASLLAAHAVPQGEFRLERVLRRDLFDGKAIIVNRGWLIRFDAAARGGVEVTGEQVMSVVDAPPALAALARLEEQRAASLLPLRLSASGTIVDLPGDSALDPLPDTVIEAVADYVAGHSSAPAVDLNVREFVAQLSQRQMGWLSHLPSDLLFPAPRDRTATREVALADGGQGRVELREMAQADPASGLLESFVREAITTIGESARRAGETWRLYATVL